jgi:hypothetical protein
MIMVTLLSETCMSLCAEHVALIATMTATVLQCSCLGRRLWTRMWTQVQWTQLQTPGSDPWKPDPGQKLGGPR